MPTPVSTLGPMDALSLVLPTGIDAGELEKWRLADGTSLSEVAALIQAAVSLSNDTMLNHPVYSTLFSVTDDLMVEYGSGQQARMEQRTEYSKPTPQPVTTLGHHLPLNGFDLGLEWTRDFLANARMVKIETKISQAMTAARTNFVKQLLTRFFSNADNAIATSGYDVGFVSGGGNVPLVPPTYNGQSFASTHTHFDRQADSADGREAAVSAGVIHLFEHGHVGPYKMIIPTTDVETWRAIDSASSPFVRWVDPVNAVNWPQGATAPLTSNSAQSDQYYVGQFNTVHGLVDVWATPQLPTDYVGIYKSYGLANDMNPLAVRYNPAFGAGVIAIAPPNYTMFPLEGMVLMHDFGVGVRDRLAGYACYFASSGNYVVPTIT